MFNVSALLVKWRAADFPRQHNFIFNNAYMLQTYNEQTHLLLKKMCFLDHMIANFNSALYNQDCFYTSRDKDLLVSIDLVVMRNLPTSLKHHSDTQFAKIISS